MKKLSVSSCIVLSVLNLLLPSTVLISSFLGYSVFINAFFLSFFTALVSLLFVIIICFKKTWTVGRACKIIFFLLPAFSIINGFFYLTFDKSPAVLIFIITSMVCTVILLFKSVKSTSVKLTGVGIYSAFFIIYLLAFYFALMFSGIALETVVRTVPSPNGKYEAQVIDRDEGALGGSTYVYICEKQGDISLFPFTFQKKPRKIYSGDWGEFEILVPYWTEENSVVIFGKEYELQ